MVKKCKFGKWFILLNTLILGAMAALSHFLYEFTGKSVAVGLFNPVNESVWEHLKFMFFPNIIWWVIVYFILRKKSDIKIKNWIVTAGVSAVIAPFMTVFLYYSYTQSFGREWLAADIIIVFISYFIALLAAFHIYKYFNACKTAVILSSAIIAVIFFAFVVFTFVTPHIPIFCDPRSGLYGIEL